MPFFDSLPGYAALLLFLPFLLLRLQQRPSKHVVGGVEPFLAAKSLGETQEQKRPLSFWLFLVAYLGATAALILGHETQPESVLFEDQSVSVLRASVESPSSSANHVVVGNANQSIQQMDLLQAIERLPGSSKVTVWTDLPSPHHLPTWIEWDNQAFFGQQDIRGVILSAQPVSATEWRVHWAKQASVSASLQCGTWSSNALTGEAGSTLVLVADGLDAIHLSIQGEPAKNDLLVSGWLLPKVRIQLPADANSSWQAVALAAWPSANLSIASSLGLEINQQKVELQELNDSMPWSREPAPEEVARFAQVMRASITAVNPPRDAREYLPQAPVDASHFKFAAHSDSGPPQVALWMVFVVLLAAGCVAFAWMKMPSEGEASYSEV